MMMLRLFLVLFVTLVTHATLTSSLSHMKASGEKIARWRSSLDPQQYQVDPVHFSVINTRSMVSPYRINLSVFNHNFNLTLQRLGASVFSPGFKFQGQPMSRHDLAQIERNIFTDPTNLAVLEVTQNREGEYELSGYINGMGIRRDNITSTHYGVRSVQKKEVNINPIVRRPPHWNNKITSGTISTLTRNTTTSATSGVEDSQSNTRIDRKKGGIAELKILYDQTLGNLIGEYAETEEDKNKFRIFYAAVMVTASNLIFDDITDPKVQLRLTEVDMLTPEDDNVIVQKTDQFIIDMMWALMDKKTLYEGPSDLVVLLTGVVTLTFDAEGKQDEGTLGISGAEKGDPGPCNEKKQNNKVSVCRDTTATWSSIKVMTHELGHGLDADEDIDTECDVGETDFIMGYYFKSTLNTFKFSECSKKSIKKFLESPKANCLFRRKTLDADLGEGIPYLPGEIFGINDQCGYYLQQKNCVSDPDKVKPVTNCIAYPCPILEGTKCLDYNPDELTEGEKPKPIIYNKVLDGTPCTVKSHDGKCIRGVCTTD